VPPPRRRHLAYRVLSGSTAIACVLVGVVFLAAFCDRALFQVFAHPLFDTDYGGYYVLGVAGTILFAWGGCLVAAARDPERASGVGTATATALIAGSILRLLAWYSGEYRLQDDQLQLEAAALALVALAFVWLRPAREPRS